MDRKTKFAFGSFVIVGAVAALIWTAVSETSAYFMTVEEWAASRGAHDGQPLRLAGRVAGGSVEWDPATLDLAFAIVPIPPKTDVHMPRPVVAPEEFAKARLPVRYNGILPDMFGEDRDVIVEGRVHEGVFAAETLLTTCPSKYEAELEPEAMPDAAAAAVGTPRETVPDGAVADG